jgi:hypothetical protein
VGDTGLEPVTSALSIRLEAQTTAGEIGETARVQVFLDNYSTANGCWPTLFMHSVWEEMWEE